MNSKETNLNFQLIEALIYVQGEVGLSVSNYKILANVSTQQARKELKSFKEYFNELKHGIFVVEFNDVFKFATHKEHKDQIAQLVNIVKKQKLSSASIETAGIIAYKQPITKSQINEIRGVSSESVVNTLLAKELIEERGVAPTMGNPVLYGITNKFYDYFQLKSLKELPEFSDLNEEQQMENNFDLFSSQREDN